MCTVVMSHVYAVEYIAAMIGASRELGKKGKEQVSSILFISIPEVEVIVSHGSQPSVAQSQDLLDDRRARRQLGLVKRKDLRRSHQRTLFPDPAINELSGSEKGKDQTRRTFSMDPQQRPGGLPLFEKTAAEEPVCCVLVLSAAQENVICGWIGS